MKKIIWKEMLNSDLENLSFLISGKVIHQAYFSQRGVDIGRGDRSGENTFVILFQDEDSDRSGIAVRTTVGFGNEDFLVVPVIYERITVEDQQDVDPDGRWESK